MIAEAIASGYCLVALFLSYKSLFWRLVVVLDAVMKNIFMVLCFFFPPYSEAL